MYPQKNSARLPHDYHDYRTISRVGRIEIRPGNFRPPEHERIEIRPGNIFVFVGTG